MYHFRWAYAESAAKASSILPMFLSGPFGVPGTVQESSVRNVGLSQLFRTRQEGRLAFVGSTPHTTPILEQGFIDLLMALEKHFVVSGSRFLMGRRPTVADFALFGQLSQLVTWDPTSVRLAEKYAPSVIAWVQFVEDLSGLEYAIDTEISFESYSSEFYLTFREILIQVARFYVPFMLANHETLYTGGREVRCEMDGNVSWISQPFKYQAKCLEQLRRKFGRLSSFDQKAFLDLLEGSGCDLLFTKPIVVQSKL
eukprot:TRINITY_DN4272_c0_g2_i6.p1 TRINITY_DN4272_c0_g2~~TRINITY_DN4272_c0_g2_i6.p1  ORF type:complete len:255 (+),score=25.04 TRINITY_DN4272_c0_g2_i6:370-1134(+)